MTAFMNERSRRITERRAVLEAPHALGVRNVELKGKGYHRIFAAFRATMLSTF
jgi:hypothetical protein